MSVVSSIVRDARGHAVGVATRAGPPSAPPSPAVVGAASLASVLSWEMGSSPYWSDFGYHPPGVVTPDDSWLAPDGTRWLHARESRSGRFVHVWREPADLAAALARGARLRAIARAGGDNDVTPMVSAPPSPAGRIEALLDPALGPGGRKHDAGEADYDAITATDPDGDLDLAAEAAATLRRLAARTRARRSDAEHARRAAREDAAEGAEAARKKAAHKRGATRMSAMTDDEAGEADVGGFRLTNPTREDVLAARKPRRRKR